MTRPSIPELTIGLLLGLAYSAVQAGDASGVNCTIGPSFTDPNPQSSAYMNQVCQEWQNAITVAQAGSVSGSANPQGGGTTAGPGTGPSTDVGPVGDPTAQSPKPAPRPRIDTLPPGMVLPAPSSTPAAPAAVPSLGSAGRKATDPGITWEDFERACLAYHQVNLGLSAANATSTARRSRRPTVSPRPALRVV